MKDANFSTKFNLSSEISHQISAKTWILVKL